MTWRELLGELVRLRAEVVGLPAVLDRVNRVEDSDGPGIGDTGEAARELVGKLDEAKRSRWPATIGVVRH
jgi:hypothetical protein